MNKKYDKISLYEKVKIMILNNIIIFQGKYEDIRIIREDLKIFREKRKNSLFYHENTTKYLKKLTVFEEYQRNYLFELKINFTYSKNNLKELIETIPYKNVTIAHMCWNTKKNLWIVNNQKYIEEFRLIPEFAIHSILYDYMQYKESAIILDSFETLKYDRNTQKVVINEKVMTYDELLDLIFTKTLKGKEFFSILEEFIHNFHDKCINSYDDIYANNKEIVGNEEPSPLGLFIVTFGILGIIFLLIKLMGYL